MKGSPQLIDGGLASFYLSAKELVIGAGFADEIDWQETASLDRLDERTFLCESAWVVLSAGFREAVLRRRFPEISKAFLHWSGARDIVNRRETCRRDALLAFRNPRKIDAILSIAERVAEDGLAQISRQLREGATDFLQELPYIGPVTACHLAKNLGLPVVKPDRHLVRLASDAGYESPGIMCEVICDLVGDSLPVIDIVLWRFATLGGSIGQPCWLEARSPVETKGAEALNATTLGSSLFLGVASASTPRSRSPRRANQI